MPPRVATQTSVAAPGPTPVSMPRATPAGSPRLCVHNELEEISEKAYNCMWTIYCAIIENYVAVVTVLVVIILSFLLPDITQKLHATNELKSMKKILDKMSSEVKRAEVACLTVADEICCLHCNMHDDTTETSKQGIRNLSVCTSHCMRTTQSEPVQVEKKIGFFRRIFFPNRNTSHKEVTIMSYVYTDSFDAKKTVSPK